MCLQKYCKTFKYFTQYSLSIHALCLNLYFDRAFSSSTETKVLYLMEKMNTLVTYVAT